MSSATSNQVRIVIELLCNILQENNIAILRAEILRQAKFNNDTVTEQLAEVLLRVIQFCENKILPPGSWFSPTEKSETVIYIKSKLQAWGYLCRSLAVLPDDLSHGSRVLLLALGWVMNKQKLMDKIIRQRSNPIHQSLHNFCGTPAKSNESDSTVPKRDLLQLAQKTSPVEKIQQQLTLTGKLRMAMRRLYSVTVQKSNLVQTIEKCTKGVSLQADLDHLTPLEVYLLRYPSSMKQMLQAMEQDNEELRHLLQWRDKSCVFWEWMDSVLLLHHQEKGQSVLTPKAEIEEVHLPIPANLSEDIVKARTRLRDFILSHESDMDRMEQLVLRKKISQVEIEMVCRHVDQELNGLAYVLQDCGRGPEPDDGSKTDDNTPSSDYALPPLDHTDSNRLFTRQKANMRSEKAIKAEHKAHIVEAAKKEISKLKERVRKLEDELKERQVFHMQELQEILNKDERFICIQPRCFKQMIC